MRLSIPLHPCSVPFPFTLKNALLGVLILSAVSVAVPTYAEAAAADASTVAADVASGRVLSEIINDASANGMSMKDIFAALQSANVPVDTIVYAAITDGISQTAVITAAIESGGDFTQVVAAATSAGASQATITDAAVNAGVSREVVAGAIAASSGRTGAGYSAPTPSAGGSTFTPPSGSSPTIGGGGGGGGGGGVPASPIKPSGKAGYR